MFSGIHDDCRVKFGNIKKCLMYLLSCNVGEIVLLARLHGMSAPANEFLQNYAVRMLRDLAAGGHVMKYRPVVGWGQLPEGWSFVEATSVAVDARDNVYVFNRGVHPVIVFDREGTFLRSWGEGTVRRAHGITIGPESPRLLAGTGQDRTHLLIVCTAERGLCGAFNSSIARLARDHATRLMGQGKTVKILCVGKKGYDILRRQFAE